MTAHGINIKYVMKKIIYWGVSVRFFKILFLTIAVTAPFSLRASAASTASLDAMIHEQMSGETQGAPLSHDAAQGDGAHNSSEAAKGAEEARPQAHEEGAASPAEQPAASAALEEPAPAELPEVYEISLGLIADADRRGKTRSLSEEFYASGRRDKAASVIGRALGEENDFSLHYLGSFCLKTLPAAGDREAQAEFLTGLMRGYSRCGVLMFTTDAVKAFAVYPPSRGSAWKAGPDGAARAAEGERVYKGDAVVFIPFPYGTRFTVDLTAKNGANVKMWKILPGSSVVRNWQGGVWEKEITVVGAVK